MLENLSVQGSSEFTDLSQDELNKKRYQRKKRRMQRKDIIPIPRLEDRDNSEKDNDIHSSLDYWQEIEPRVNSGTEMLDFTVAQKKGEEMLE